MLVACFMAGCGSGGGHSVTSPVTPVVVAHGVTAAGIPYTVSYLHLGSGPRPPGVPSPGGSGAAGCPGLVVSTGATGGSGGPCLTPSLRRVSASVRCAGATMTITAVTPPGMRAGRLMLSDGHTVSSPVFNVPGGGSRTSGYYFQMLRTPPHAVSLTVLAGDGHTTSTTRLASAAGCAAGAASPVRPTPQGIQTLVRGVGPGGARFSIAAERYGDPGSTHWCLRAAVRAGSGSGKVSSTRYCPPRASTVLAPQIMLVSCRPTALEVVYGLLTSTADTVAITSNGRPLTVKRVAVAAALRVSGQLVYALVPGGLVTVTVKPAQGGRPATTPLPPLSGGCGTGAAAPVPPGLRPPAK